MYHVCTDTRQTCVLPAEARHAALSLNLLGTCALLRGSFHHLLFNRQTLAPPHSIHEPAREVGSTHALPLLAKLLPLLLRDRQEEGIHLQV